MVRAHALTGCIHRQQKVTMTALVIVESPTKATKIASFLGDGYLVESSRGHVRDLPSGAADVPAKYKGQPWARTGINIDQDFAPLYVVSPDKKATIKSLKDKLTHVDELLLATDEDREGEAIAWHLLQELKPKVPVKRMVFHEITPEAIRAAVESPRQLDTDLVDAQETRRIVDRLYGYEVSPVLWKKVKPRLSAGRVQSVATRLLVDRERERIAFRVATFADLIATLDAGQSAEPPTFDVRLISVDGQKVATGKDFDSLGSLTGNAVQLDEATATQLAAELKDAQFTVRKVESKPFTRRPYAPFRTSTLQQEAGRKLGFSAARTMGVAQDLYEGGYITYMRTDSITLSGTAIRASREAIANLYGERYLPEKPRVYASKVSNAQEAHEAIRPAGETFKTPRQSGLVGDQLKLYELIWTRTIASQMADAKGMTVSVSTEADAHGKPCVLTASGSTITFPGFLRAYVEGKDIDEDEETAARLPELREGQLLSALDVRPETHQTKPPARYTEPSLVAKLEDLGIGRPSTYAAIIRTITARDYAFKKGSALVPTWLAFAVTRLMESHFNKLVDYEFTADMEGVLDAIARGEQNRLSTLRDFYFGEGEDPGLQTLVNDLGEIDARALATFPLDPNNPESVVVRVGRYGTYVEDAEGHRANVADDLPPEELTLEYARELLASPMGEERELGVDPDTQFTVVVRAGRYGPYVTEVLPEGVTGKPRTASLFASMTLESVTLEDALKLMSLPRVVGIDPEGREITAQNGRYGPYLKRGTDSRSLTSEEQIFSITMEQAEAIYAQPKQRGRVAAKPPLRELGTDPTTQRPVVVKEGRFGPYITDGQTNVTLPRAERPEDISQSRAYELLAEKRAKGPAPKKRTAKKTTTKTAAKKTTAKKTTAKKSATKSTE